MPVPFAKKELLNLTPIAIFNEVFLAKVQSDSPFSYVKKSVIHDLNIYDGHFMIMLPISYKNRSSRFAFEIYESLSEDFVLGTHIVNELQITSLKLQ